MYKLIAIDIDDTLINDNKEVTPATQTALEIGRASCRERVF